MTRYLLIALLIIGSFVSGISLASVLPRYHVLYGFNWNHYRCYDSNPFEASRQMEGDNNTGFYDLDDASHYASPRAMLIKGDVEAIYFVYEHPDFNQHYMIQFTCPEWASRNRIAIHTPFGTWGQWQPSGDGILGERPE